MSGEYIDFGFDEFQKDLNKLDEKLKRIDEKQKDEIAQQVLSDVSQVFLAEQKRLLRSAPNPAYHRFADWLQVWIYKNKSGWRLQVGYPTDVIKEHIEVLIAEFGRPGAKGLKKGGKDSKGRKIGKIEAYSHIRASMFLKREEVMAEVQRRWEEEILEEWERG